MRRNERCGRWCALALAAALLAAGPAAATDEPVGRGGMPAVSEGTLLGRSAVSGRFEPVPLRHTDVAIDVRGLVAATTVVQRYENDSDEALEAVYVFPLPHQAAVHEMEIRIGERVIRGVVQEREQARRTYLAARDEGRRAALLEQERPNVFTASVANVMPGDRIDVRIRYVEPLEMTDGLVRLVFPMVVGPRYIPGTPLGGPDAGTGWARDTDQVQDASRVTPPVRHPGSRPGHDVSLTATIDLGVPAESVTSPTHPVTAVPAPRSQSDRARVGTPEFTSGVPDGSATVVRLTEAATLPNKDFVLEVRRAPAGVPRASLFLSPHPDGAETAFMLVAYPPTAPAAGDRLPLDVVFLIDVSGSMEGHSIRQAREALLQGLDRLRPDDTFNVVAYSDRFAGLAPAALAAYGDDLERGRRFVAGLRAGGGTELLPALEHVLALPVAEGRLRYVVLLTDGCLGNEDAVHSTLSRGLGPARLFTVAIGSAPNHALATKMAAIGRGSFTHIATAGEVAERMGRLLDEIESPVVADLALRFDGLTADESYPARVPDLFLARPLVLFGRLAGAGRGTLRLEGRAGAERYVESIDVDTGAATYHPGITTLWARRALEQRSDEWREAAAEARDAMRPAIVDFAVRHHLVSQFTSLVAVEDVVVNNDGAARVARVPTELPEGWSLENVFGDNPATGTADAFLEWLGVALLAGSLLAAAVRRRALAVGARR